LRLLSSTTQLAHLLLIRKMLNLLDHFNHLRLKLVALVTEKIFGGKFLGKIFGGILGALDLFFALWAGNVFAKESKSKEYLCDENHNKSIKHAPQSYIHRPTT
jgi:hypothetical protein